MPPPGAAVIEAWASRLSIRARQFGRRCAVPKAKFKGVELVRSPMRADDSSARFISMSLKTSEYSLGSALCCCRVQPSHKPEAFRAHPALTAPQFCGAGKAVARFAGADR